MTVDKRRLGDGETQTILTDENIVFVKNLPITTTKANVQALFEQYGEVLETRRKTVVGRIATMCATVSFKEVASVKTAFKKRTARKLRAALPLRSALSSHLRKERN